MKIDKLKSNNFVDAPREPGVYYFLDVNGEVLYVGKAKIIRNRIKSYYKGDLDRGPSIDKMVERAQRVKFRVTDSEIEAVLLEAEMIKKFRPRYNIKLKDDKSFHVLRITADDYPKIEFRRLKEVDFEKLFKPTQGEQYFGPYPSSYSLKKSLKYLRKIFPFRDCSKTKYNSYHKKGRTCLYGDIERCLGPCANEVAKQEYRKNTNYLKNFLRGRKKQVLRSLQKEMKEASRKHEFERAAKLRDKIDALSHLNRIAIGIRDRVFNGTKTLFKRIEAYDISNIQGDFAVGSMTVISEGKKNPSEYRKFKIKTVEGANDLLMMREVLERRLKNDWPLPDLMVVDGGATHLKLFCEVLKDHQKQIPVVAIAKGSKRDKNELHYSTDSLAKYIQRSDDLKKMIVVARDEAHRFAIEYYRKLHRKDLTNN